MLLPVFVWDIRTAEMEERHRPRLLTVCPPPQDGSVSHHSVGVDVRGSPMPWTLGCRVPESSRNTEHLGQFGRTEPAGRTMLTEDSMALHLSRGERLQDRPLCGWHCSLEELEMSLGSERGRGSGFTADSRPSTCDLQRTECSPRPEIHLASRRFSMLAQPDSLFSGH